jgi:mediator of RNA polymerase II transcription subunit 17
MAGYDNPSDGLVFPFRQNCRLQVSLSISDVASGTLSTASNAILLPIAPSLEDELKSAQIEIVEQEIFTLLVSEASNLPSVSARVSERLIILEAAQGTELKFELAS